MTIDLQDGWNFGWIQIWVPAAKKDESASASEIHFRHVHVWCHVHMCFIFFWMFYCPGGLVEVSGFYPPLLLPCFVLPPGCWAKFKIAASNCHLFVTRIGWSWIVFQLPDVSQLSLKLVDLELCRSAFRCLSIVTQICWFWIGLQLQIVTRLSLVCHSIWLILNCFSASRCLVICHSDWSWMFFRFSYAFLSMVGHSNVFQLVLHMFFICPSNSSYSWWLGPISMPMVEIVVRALSEWHWWTLPKLSRVEMNHKLMTSIPLQTLWEDNACKTHIFCMFKMDVLGPWFSTRIIASIYQAEAKVKS